MSQILIGIDDPKYVFSNLFGLFEIKFRSKHGLFENGFKRFLILKIRKNLGLDVPNYRCCQKANFNFF